MDLPRNHRHRCILTFVLIYSVGSIVHVNSYTEANLNTKPNIILIIADDLVRIKYSMFKVIEIHVS